MGGRDSGEAGGLNATPSQLQAPWLQVSLPAGISQSLLTAPPNGLPGNETKWCLIYGYLIFLCLDFVCNR